MTHSSVKIVMTLGPPPVPYAGASGHINPGKRFAPILPHEPPFLRFWRLVNDYREQNGQPELFLRDAMKRYRNLLDGREGVWL